MTEAEWLACDRPAEMLRLFRGTLTQLASGGHVRHPPDVVAVSERKLRLFACACVRQVWQRLTDERSRKAVEVAEKYADALASEIERLAACGEAHIVFAHGEAGEPAWMAWQVTCNEPTRIWANAKHPSRTTQASLLREIIGSPFRPVRLPLAWAPLSDFAGEWGSPEDIERLRAEGHIVCPWQTADVLALAQAAYEERPGRVCEKCDGKGNTWNHRFKHAAFCSACDKGRVHDGAIAADCLAVLADALIDAGCDDDDLLAHLRLPETHVRGCWALDVVLGRG